MLPSWNDGPARTAIVDFVDRVTEEGGADFVPPAERVAVLDNDGTLWCERPAYVQALFVLGRLREAAEARPELAEKPVVKALLAGDLAGRASTASRRSPYCSSSTPGARRKSSPATPSAGSRWPSIRASTSRSANSPTPR